MTNIAQQRDNDCNVHMDDFEHSKENIQPLKSGRRATALKRTFGTVLTTEANGTKNESICTDNTQHKKVKLTPTNLKDEHQQWQQKLLRCFSLSPEDPLRIWLQYLRWIEDHYPALGTDSQYTLVLERCSRLFSSDDHLAHYRNDSRFIRMVWMRLADRTSNSSDSVLDMYNHMYQRGIGTKEAQLYLQWAQLLEDIGDTKSADQVLGQAQTHIPQLQSDETRDTTNMALKKLKTYHDNFKYRVMKRMMEEQKKKREQERNDAMVSLEQQRQEILQQNNIGVLNTRTEQVPQPPQRALLAEIDASSRSALGNAVLAPQTTRSRVPRSAIPGSSFSLRLGSQASKRSTSSLTTATKTARKMRPLSSMLRSSNNSSGSGSNDNVNTETHAASPMNEDVLDDTEMHDRCENNKFVIFDDSENASSDNDSHAHDQRVLPFHLPNGNSGFMHRQHLPSEQETTKENSAQPSKWVIHRIPAHRDQSIATATVTRTASFEIFSDESDNATTTTMTTTGSQHLNLQHQRFTITTATSTSSENRVKKLSSSKFVIDSSRLRR